jgi:nicotinate-nucleotide--dimethylbenzimidazole phosphoribosyltransferase
VRIVDVGVAGSIGAIGDAAQLVTARVREGTGNIACGPAMSEPELWQALGVGLEQAERAAADGVALVGLGEMGIGSSTAASAMTAALTRTAAARVTGRGASSLPTAAAPSPAHA